MRNLSEEARYFRFMQSLQELTPEMLLRFTQIDYHHEMALIATTEHEGGEQQLGVTRYLTNPDKKSCEFALVVSDQWQRKGIAHRLMHQLMEVARARGLELIQGEVLANNHKMLDLVRSLNFQIQNDPDDPSIKNVALQL
jgi:acetyltransferase